MSHTLNKELKIGSSVFYQGVVFTIVAMTQYDFVLYDENKSNVGITVKKHKVEPLATDLFKKGDKVRSIFGNFVGVVMGFEEETNRIYCRSDKSTSDRTRYAYKPCEIVIQKPEPLFELGKTYHVLPFGQQFFIEATPLPHPDQPHLFVLYNNKNGNCLGTVPMDITREDLKDFEIKNVVR